MKWSKINSDCEKFKMHTLTSRASTIVNNAKRCM